MLRGSYSFSVDRPEFRELAPFSYFDFTDFVDRQGNPNVKSARIHNLDLRLEYYPEPGTFLAFGGFYKRFSNPIERRLEPGVSNPVLIATNADRGTSYGAELEARGSLDLLTEDELLSRFGLMANTSLIFSEIRFSPKEAKAQVQQRPMMGQSPYLVNAGVFYEDPERQIEVNALYNVFGQKLFAVGSRASPNQYVMPRHQVDMNLKWHYNHHWQFKLVLQNLLNAPYRVGQDVDFDDHIDPEEDVIIIEYNEGVYTRLGATYSF